MLKINLYRLIDKAPITEGLRLRLRRYLLDKDSLHASSDTDNLLFEYHLQEEAESAYHSKNLLRAARNLRIQTPPFYKDEHKLSEYWVRSGLNGNRFFLSLLGEKKIRDAIREEEEYRSEKWAKRIPFITAITGLIGTVTGLVSFLNK